MMNGPLPQQRPERQNIMSAPQEGMAAPAGGGHDNTKRRRARRPVPSRSKTNQGPRAGATRRRAPTGAMAGRTSRSRTISRRTVGRARRPRFFHIGCHFSKAAGLSVSVYASTRVLIILTPLVPGAAVLLKLLGLYGA